MDFGEKLDLLMTISKTTNSALARSVSLDPSFVSRLRRGVRSPAKNENYIRAIAVHFARACSSDYQKAALSKVIKADLESLQADTEKVAELLYSWLSQKGTDHTASVKHFLGGLTQFKFKKMHQVIAPDDKELSHCTAMKEGVYYGIEGKRTAVLYFLSCVIKSKKPQTLLLFSDEDLEWLTGDHAFTANWAALLSQVILCGNKIKIIHTVNRSLDEMFSAIEQWLPLYMTGAIEPYYYAKTRDGIFKRTLFLAPDTAAVASTSVGAQTSDAANFLYTAPATIASLTEEFYSYLSLCRPLMRVFTPPIKNECISTLAEFEQEDANSIIKTDLLSSVTMPPDVATSMHARLKNEQRDQILAYHLKRYKTFEDSLHKYQFTEIITLPDLHLIHKDLAKVMFSDMLGNADLSYTPGEFAGHLANIIRLLKTYENYNVYMLPKEMAGYMLYVKEDVGLLVAKTSRPSVIFAISESNMTAAFWDYLKMLTEKALKKKASRKTTIAELEAIANTLPRPN